MTGIVVINKPADWTSHDVVARMRRILKEKRIGHGGTLDPMATGVLPLFVGRATRAVEFMENADKEYIAGMRLGISTDTQDTTGRVLEQREVTAGAAEIERAVRELAGSMEQLPPMYSAIKLNGKKMYEYARKGQSVELKPRRIYIHEAEPLGFSEGEYRFRVVCSKGTYVRTLCHDIGEKLGCGAAMSSLIRTRAGIFGIDDAVSLQQAESLAQAALMPLDTMFTQLDAITVDREDRRRILCGQDPTLRAEDGRYRLYAQEGEFLAVAEAKNGQLSVIKSFFEV